MFFFYYKLIGFREFSGTFLYFTVKDIDTFTNKTMPVVLTLDGNSEIDAHEWHVFWLTSVTNLKFII